MTQHPSDLAASWYRLLGADEALEQGDQLFDFPLLYAMRDEQGMPTAVEASAALIVLTQNCDLAHDKANTVLMAPMASIADWIMENPYDLERLEVIRQGFDASLYLVPGWLDGPIEEARDDRIVDFGTLYSVATSDVKSVLGTLRQRIALASPAREHFSQAVARSFMRVGLPIDIPSFRLNRVSSDKQMLTTLSLLGSDDLTGQRSYTLARPLSVVLYTRERVATGEKYYRLITAEQPAVEGAGYTAEQAQQSLARQMVRRMLEGDERWRWIHGFIATNM